MAAFTDVRFKGVKGFRVLTVDVLNFKGTPQDLERFKSFWLKHGDLYDTEHLLSGNVISMSFGLLESHECTTLKEMWDYMIKEGG